ncbi:Ig-like domain-containing protein [Lacibacter sp. H407]|uniref:Ig-like domain-containing protein n=1 Tax=Lacibacter sp. H407 TaxID=3133423 RepID=UPI0030BEB450
MKNLIRPVSMSALVVVTFLAACKKEVSNQSNENQAESAQVRLSGAIEDPQAVVIKTPFIVSSNLSKTAGKVSSYSIAPLFKGRPTKADITPPAAKITSPGNSATASGTITIATEATDNIGIASVKLMVDGVAKDSLKAAPYNFSWNASSVADGTHTLTAVARDAAGNTGSYTITVAVNTTITVLPPTTTLPSSYMLATPTAKAQGNEGSCVAFATAYAARSIEQYYRTGATGFDNSTNVFSPEYVYNQTKIASDCGSGTAITLTLDLMKNKGVAPWATMPYSDINGCSLLPTSAIDAAAAAYKIGGYSKLLNTDKNAIKTMLVAKHPVIISVTLDDKISNAGPGFIWNSAGFGNIGHGMIICGYDDSKNAYKVMNSWGTNWGDAGFTWIDYDFFPTRAGYYVYVMNY